MFEKCKASTSTHTQTWQKKLPKAANITGLPLQRWLIKHVLCLDWPTTFALNPRAPCFIETALVASFHALSDSPLCTKQHHLLRQRWWQKPTPSAHGWTGEIRIDTKLLSTEVPVNCAKVPRNRKDSENYKYIKDHQVIQVHTSTLQLNPFVTCWSSHLWEAALPGPRPSQLLWFPQSKFVQRRSPWDHFQVRLQCSTGCSPGQNSRPEEGNASFTDL